jgi:hypothetical protein
MNKIILPLVIAAACTALPELCSAAVGAAPCAQVARALPSDPRVAASLADQLKAPSARVLQSFAYGSWRILYVETPTADEAYVFFSSDPRTQHYVTLWSGAAQKGETAEIRMWALANAPGIPPALAACFADHVTRHRDR